MKIRQDFITNSSSSSFICLRCRDDIECYDWEEQWDREICDACFDNLDGEIKELVEVTERSSDKEVAIIMDTVSFIEYLCAELCLDKDKIMEKYKEWRKQK